MLNEASSEHPPQTGSASFTGPAIQWRARSDARLARKSPDVCTVSCRGTTATLSGVTPGMAAALEQLFFEGADEAGLSDLLLDEPPSALVEWYCHLDLLQRQTAIEWVAADGLGELARMTALSGAFRPSFAALDPTRVYTLSTFMFLRPVAGAWIAESPLGHARVTLTARGAALLAGLPVPGTPIELGTAATDAAPGIEPLLLLLAAAGMLTGTDAAGRSEADVEAAARGWSFSDALFHFRSREGRFDGPFGARPGSLAPDPLPRRRDPGALGRIPLPATERRQPAVTLADALTTRRSLRRYGSLPVGLPALAEFLRQVAGDVAGEPVRRSYPSGGATYPLQVYVVAACCDGLAREILRYDPATDSLDRISSSADAVGDLLHMYEGKAAGDPLQVLLLVTFEMGRVSRRYDGIAYALALKETGALLQTMYLAATALGLAPCAIGMGNGDVAARALGLDPLREAVIGEFALGSAP